MNTSILKLKATVIRPKDFDELDGLAASMDDVNLLIDALQHMFEEDMSSSRALTLRKLIVVEHTKPMGNAYRDTIERALAARLKQPNDAPTSYEDYEVTYHREMLPDEVKVTEYNYNSQSV